MSASSISSHDRSAGAYLRLYTHNIWGRHGDWPARRQVLIDGIHELGPDVVTVQETIVLDGYDQVADVCGEGWNIAHSRERAPDGTGISIASRWPIIGIDEPDLNVTPRTADFSCTAMLARIDHIFIRCGEHGGPTLRIDGCELAFAEPADQVWASDHYGLVADVASSE